MFPLDRMVDAPVPMVFVSVLYLLWLQYHLGKLVGQLGEGHLVDWLDGWDYKL